MKTLKPFLLILFLSFTYMQAKEKIQWLIWEVTPEFIVHGKEKGQGYADKFLQTFIDNLPEYEHEIIVLNTKRWFLESSKKGRCTPHIWKRFKLDTQYYSNAYTITSPHGILIHKKDMHKFGEENQVLSVEKLLKNDELKLAIPLLKYKNEASRYPILYYYLQSYQGKKNLLEITSNANEITPKLLDKGRADYLISYPTAATAYARINEQENAYMFYTIKEDPYYKKIHVSCHDDELGQEIIKKINKMITTSLHEKFLSYHEEWNGKNKQFREIYIDYFIQAIDDSFIIQ